MTILHNDTAYALLFWMLVGHALADYPLQGDFLSKAKNHRSPIPTVPWQIALFNHALIHAGAVALLTGSLAFGLLELLLHVGIDYLKCDGVTNFDADQALHVSCKVFYCVAIFYGLLGVMSLLCVVAALAVAYLAVCALSRKLG